MVIEVKIVADSISSEGKRLTSMQLKYPRYVHSELMTHRVFSRNASSTRAIPTAKLADKSFEEMVTPIKWGVNQPGMQAKEEQLVGWRKIAAKTIWTAMAWVCTNGTKLLARLGLHKQWAGRPTEWFGHIEVILTSTEWSNFFELRNHEDAQPEIRALAQKMLSAMNSSSPKLLKPGMWHLPYITQTDRNHLLATECSERTMLEGLRRISAARCCRVSYLKHDGTNSSLEEDLTLCDRLVASRPIHASPFEHQATPDKPKYLVGGTARIGWAHPELHGNFQGWVQYRKQLENTFN